MRHIYAKLGVHRRTKAVRRVDRDAHAMDEPAGPVRYELRVRGLLSEALLGAPSRACTRRRDGAETVLAGELPDQAALYGALTQIEAFGLELLEVRRQRA